jgi:hypothetical protein
MRMTELEDCAPMWTTEASDHLLVVPSDEYELTYQNAAIVKQSTWAFTILEDDYLCNEVKRRMYEAGVRVVRLSEILHLWPRA